MAGKKEDAPVESSAPKASGDDNLFGALCYIIGVLVPLFVLFTDKKSNKFLAFHAWQSLILSVVVFVVFFGVGIVVGVLSVISGGLGLVLSCVYPIMWLAVLCAMLFSAYKAYLGEKYKLPILGDFAEKQASK
jgi:uncharacterized membrane protein